jgi:hypothetical protein
MRNPARQGRSICPGSSRGRTRQLKQIDAGLLNVGYAEVGLTNGPAVILLHGWPYDIYSYVDVAPLLASAGYRVIVPYLRGYGTTRFLSDQTFRNGQPSALAVDVIALMDALYYPRGRCKRSAASGLQRLRQKFSGKYSHRTIKGGIGHNLPQQAPQAFAEAVVEVTEI